ncbi:FadR/GntR family transcriptional regulator [Alcanivoracaceae bacterium MT1]
MSQPKKNPSAAKGPGRSVPAGGLSVERVKLSTQVYEELGQRIVDGEYRTGETLPSEAELGQAFGVSRTVVREALQQLVSYGLVQSRPKIGARVMPWDEWEFGNAAVIGWVSRSPGKEDFLRHVTELRAVIEPHAAALAARRINVEQREDIQRALALMEQAVSCVDVELFKDADALFHYALTRSSGNPLLIDFMGRLHHALTLSRDNSTRAIDLDQMLERMAVHTREELGRKALEAHEAVAKAVFAGDESGARRAMETLIDEVDSALEVVFSEVKGSGAG